MDVAISADPRIKRIKQEEKEAREAKRKNKSGPGGGLTKAQAEEAKRRAEEEAKAKEEAEKVRVLRHVQCSYLADGLPRLRRQRQRRRRPRPQMLRRKHGVLREPRVLLRSHNDALCHGGTRIQNCVSFVASARVVVTDSSIALDVSVVLAY